MPHKVVKSLSLVVAALLAVVADANCPSAATGLRINHMQVMGSHNSYHVYGNDIFSVNHSAVNVQLDNGVRALEFDINYNITTGELDVFHTPNIDMFTSCHTLRECLQLVAAWSHQHPQHVPLLIQLEMKGVLDKQPCDDVVVGNLLTCLGQNCDGVDGSNLTALGECAIPACVVQLLPLQLQPACGAALPCIVDEASSITTITNAQLQTLGQTCSGIDGLVEVTAADKANRVPTIAAKIAADIDATFPANMRVQPNNLFPFNGKDEAAAMADYMANPTSASVNFWPLIDDARGKALFYGQNMNEASWWSTALHAADRPLFVDVNDTAVNQELNIVQNSISNKLQSGVFTRVRTEPLLDPNTLLADLLAGTVDLNSLLPVVNTTWRDAALSSGGHVISTDYIPDRPYTDWASMNASTTISLTGGMPVRCNSMTIPSGVTCSAQMLENPSELMCGATMTTTTTITQMTTTGATNMMTTMMPTTTPSPTIAADVATGAWKPTPGAVLMSLLFLLAAARM